MCIWDVEFHDLIGVRLPALVIIFVDTPHRDMYELTCSHSSPVVPPEPL